MRIRIDFFVLTLLSNLCFAELPCDLLRKDPAYTIGFVKNSQGFCSGVLVSPHLVLTAAHCVKGEEASNVYFSLAEGKFSPSVKFLMHPTYWKARDGSAGGADLALLVLRDTGYGTTPKYFMPFLSPGQLKDKEKMISWGFGLQDDGGFSKRHKKVVIYTGQGDTLSVDGKSLKGFRLNFERGETGELQCSGDSGGPVLTERQGVWHIVGINSRSGAKIKYASKAALKRKLASKEYFCHHADKFMSVAAGHFLDWVTENVNQFETDRSKPLCAN